MEKSKIIEYALNFLLANIDETTEEDLGMTHEEIEKSIEYIKFFNKQICNVLKN